MAISQYSNPIQNTLEQYVPLPLEMMMKAGQATQQRYDQSQDLDTSTQSGLASIEARAPGYQQYVQNTVGNYKNDMSSLIDKYNGRIDDPQFQREQKQVINKYKNDPNWNIIKNSNEAIKTDQDISAKLRAEGKLVINPTLGFNGLDNSGNLQQYQGGVKQVNTLDDWEKGLALAHGSMQFDGRGFNTNARSLDAARQAILSDVANNGPQTKDLITAYTQQGLTPEQAKAAVIGNVGTLVNKYGVVKTRDEGYFSNQIARDNMALTEKYHKDALDEKRDAFKANNDTKLAIAYMKAHGRNGDGSPIITPYAIPTNNQPIKTGSEDNLRGYVAAVSNTPMNEAIKGSTINGQYFGLDPNQKSEKNLTRRAGSFTINDGIKTGVKNVWVTEQGNLVTGGKNYPVTQKTDPKTGEVYNWMGKDANNGQRVRQQTVIEYTERNSANTGGNSITTTPKTYLKLANKDEAIKYMGADNAFYSGKNANSSFHNLGVNIVKKGTNGSDDIIKPTRNISIPNNKIIEAANYEYQDPDQRLKFIQQVQNAIKLANTSGIDKTSFEQLRKLESDDYHDEIYHNNQIAPQFQNQSKTKALQPVDNSSDD